MDISWSRSAVKADITKVVYSACILYMSSKFTDFYLYVGPGEPLQDGNIIKST